MTLVYEWRGYFGAYKELVLSSLDIKVCFLSFTYMPVY